MGRQALLTGEHEETMKADTLGALSEAHEALVVARDKFAFYESSHHAKTLDQSRSKKVRDEAAEKAAVNRELAARMDRAVKSAAKALLIDKEDDHVGEG
jgi:hypothetical protein